MEHGCPEASARQRETQATLVSHGPPSLETMGRTKSLLSGGSDQRPRSRPSAAAIRMGRPSVARRWVASATPGRAAGRSTPLAHSAPQLPGASRLRLRLSRALPISPRRLPRGALSCLPCGASELEVIVDLPHAEHLLGEILGEPLLEPGRYVTRERHDPVAHHHLEILRVDRRAGDACVDVIEDPIVGAVIAARRMRLAAAERLRLRSPLLQGFGHVL